MRKLIQLLAVGLCMLAPYLTLAQTKTVSGIVKDAGDNAVLPKVSVRVKGTSKGVTTNEAGYYSIDAAKGQMLVFTFVGYVTKEVLVGDGNVINVELGSSEGQLGEVVVTAYGIKREKKSLGYTVQEVKGDEIAKTRRDNFINSLAGRVPGATITTTSGAPGSSTSIILRGGTSLSLTNQPLFVIDGVPLDNNVMNQERDNLLTRNTASRTDDFSNRASDINPEDIESVTILKGPEAQALYGTDAANGAIIITTKKGKSGKGTFTYDNSFRFEELFRFHTVQQVYARGTNGLTDLNTIAGVAGEAAGTGVSPSFFGSKFDPGTQLYDNIRNFFRKGFTQQHNISFEGGSDAATYRINLGYTNQDGVVPSTGYERTSIRVTGDYKLSPKSRITATANYVATGNDKATLGQGGYYLTVLQWPVDNDIRNFQNPDGSRKFLFPTTTATQFSREFDNPFWDVNKNETKDKINRILGNINYNYSLTKDISLTSIFSIDNYTQSGYQVTHPQSRYGNARGYYSKYNTKFTQLTGNVRAAVKKNFKSFRNTFTSGFYFEDNNREVDAFKGENFIEQNIASINNVDPITTAASTQIQQNRKIRWYNQLQINWKDILIPTFSYTYEGVSVLTSRLVDKSPYYPFGSASLAFNVSEFKFLKDLQKIDLLKLRVSYATSGQTAGLLPYNIDPRFGQATTTGGGYAYGVTGNNFDLNPQFTRNLEFGIEYSLFKRRITGNVVYYKNSTKDQIFFPRVSYGTGFILKYFNGGTVENKGWEATITGTIIRKKNLTWDITVNYDQFRNTIKKLNVGPGGYYDSDTWVYGSLRGQASVGQSIYSLYGTQLAKNNQGKILINPATGLPVTTAALPTSPEFPTGQAFLYLGSRAPKFSMGIQNEITWNGFSVSFNLDIRHGGAIFNATDLVLYRLGLSTKTLDRDVPRIIEGVLRDGLENSNNPTANNIVIVPTYRNDYYNGVSTTSAGFVEADFVEDVSWIRMRDIVFSYRFQSSLLKKMKINSASIYVSATDLFLITNYSGADPSVSSNNASLGGIGGAGIDYGRISTPRTVSTGIRFSF
jgi:ferric enterobactin receptor